MATTYLSGPPVTAKITKTSLKQSLDSLDHHNDIIYNANDTGVFVYKGNDNVGYANTITNGSVNGLDGYQTLLGKINMDTGSTVNSIYIIGLSGYTVATWSTNNRKFANMRITIARTQITGELIIPHLSNSSTRCRCGIYVTPPDDISNYVLGNAEKTEFAWSKSYPNSVGITGFTFYSADGPSGGIRMPTSTGPFSTFASYAEPNNNATKSLIISRIVPTDHEGLLLTSSGVLSNNFVVFDGLCDFVLGSSGDTSAVGESIISLVPSFDSEQVKSNTGMLAVAMMAKGSTKTYYLGNKNIVYKLYNGPTPYIMPPGAIVNIGKKQFMSIAYSSYFVRMN